MESARREVAGAKCSGTGCGVGKCGELNDEELKHLRLLIYVIELPAFCLQAQPGFAIRLPKTFKATLDTERTSCEAYLYL